MSASTSVCQLSGRGELTELRDILTGE